MGPRLHKKCVRGWLPATIRVDNVNTNWFVRQSGNHGAQRFRGATLTSNDPTEILGVHAHLKDVTATVPLQRDLHVVGGVYDATYQVIQRIYEHWLLSLGCFCLNGLSSRLFSLLGDGLGQDDRALLRNNERQPSVP